MKLSMILFFIVLAEICNAQLVNRIDHFAGRNGEGSWNSVPDNFGGYYAVIYFTDSIAPDPQNPQNFITTTYGNAEVVIHVSQGGQLLWMIPFTNGSMGIREMIADQSGALYMLGVNLGSLIMDSTYGFQFTPSTSSNRDMFLGKFNYNGTLAWVDQFLDVSGGLHYNDPCEIALQGNDVVIAGRFHQLLDFDPGIAQYPLQGPTNVNDYSIFLAGYSQSSGDWLRTTEITSYNGDQTLSGMECLPSGKIFITGVLDSSVDFDPGTGSTQLSGGGDDDFYIACYTANHILIWAMSCPDTICDQEIEDLAVQDNTVIICGRYAGDADFDTDTGIVTLNYNDGFLACFDTTGAFRWANAMGQGSTGTAIPMALDLWGSTVLVAGGFLGVVDLDPSPNTAIISGSTFFQKGFIAVYDQSNGTYISKGAAGGVGSLASQIGDLCHTTSTTLLIDFTFDGVLDVDLSSGADNVNCTTPSSGYITDVCIVVYDFPDIGVQENVTDNNSLLAYPSPGSENITIELPELFQGVTVYNTSGQVVLTEHFDPTGIYKLQIGSLPSGTYILEAQSEYSVVRKKISVIEQ